MLGASLWTLPAKLVLGGPQRHFLGEEGVVLCPADRCKAQPLAVVVTEVLLLYPLSSTWTSVFWEGQHVEFLCEILYPCSGPRLRAQLQAT